MRPRRPLKNRVPWRPKPVQRLTNSGPRARWRRMRPRCMSYGRRAVTRAGRSKHHGSPYPARIRRGRCVSMARRHDRGNNPAGVGQATGAAHARRWFAEHSRRRPDRYAARQCYRLGGADDGLYRCDAQRSFRGALLVSGDTVSGLPVAGYRPQSTAKVDLVNANKLAEENVLRLLDQLATLPDTDKRWL